MSNVRRPVLRSVEASTPEIDQHKAIDLARFARFFQTLQDAGMYGVVRIGMQHGKITSVTVEQVLKPDELG